MRKEDIKDIIEMLEYAERNSGKVTEKGLKKEFRKKYGLFSKYCLGGAHPWVKDIGGNRIDGEGKHEFTADGIRELDRLRDKLHQLETEEKQISIAEKQADIQEAQIVVLKQTNLIYKLVLYATGIVALITAYNFYFGVLESTSSEYSAIVGGTLVVIIAIVVTFLLLKFIVKIIPEIKEFIPWSRK